MLGGEVGGLEEMDRWGIERDRESHISGVRGW